MILMMKGYLFFHYKAIEVEGEKNSVDRCQEIIVEGEQVYFLDLLLNLTRLDAF
jgi:hypothetical protein